jgi:hypothetical protein
VVPSIKPDVADAASTGIDCERPSRAVADNGCFVYQVQVGADDACTVDGIVQIGEGDQGRKKRKQNSVTSDAAMTGPAQKDFAATAQRDTGGDDESAVTRARIQLDLASVVEYSADRKGGAIFHRDRACIGPGARAVRYCQSAGDYVQGGGAHRSERSDRVTS